MDGSLVLFSGKKICTTQMSNISCASTQFQAFTFCVPHSKIHGLIGLIKHYHLQLDPESGHGTCAIRRIPCAYISCTNMLDKPWVMGSGKIQETR